jgi:glutaredoxin 3
MSPPSKAPKIIMYTKRACPNCVSAKHLLKSKGLAFTEADVESNAALLDDLPPGVRQMPQIFVNGVRIGGLAGLQAYLPDILEGRVA